MLGTFYCGVPALHDLIRRQSHEIWLEVLEPLLFDQIAAVRNGCLLVLRLKGGASNRPFEVIKEPISARAPDGAPHRRFVYGSDLFL